MLYPKYDRLFQNFPLRYFFLKIGMGNVRGITKYVPNLQIYEHTPATPVYQGSHCSALLIGCIDFCPLRNNVGIWLIHPTHFLVNVVCLWPHVKCFAYCMDECGVCEDMSVTSIKINDGNSNQ